MYVVKDVDLSSIAMMWVGIIFGTCNRFYKRFLVNYNLMLGLAFSPNFWQDILTKTFAWQLNLTYGMHTG